MNGRFFLRKIPKRKNKKRNNSSFKNAVLKQNPIHLPQGTLSSIELKNLHEKIKILSQTKNLASNELLTSEEIGKILGVHPVEVREIQNYLKKKGMLS